jgi:hypothetical protein
MSFSYCVKIYLYRLNAALPALGKMNPRWPGFGEHREPRKRVIESARSKDTITTVDSEGYSSDAESKDSVDQGTHPPLLLNTVILR